MVDKIFKNGTKIKNKKTGKIGIVINLNRVGGSTILTYHLENTPNNKHICLKPEERFDIV